MFLSQLKVKAEAINKIMLELVIINRVIVTIRILLIKKVLLQPNFETRSRLHMNFCIMGRPFSMYIVISIRTEILSYSRATHICEKYPKGIGKPRKLIFCFHY